MILNPETKIICEELRIGGVKSVILIGSRARGDEAKDSDYDLYVVISSLIVPFIYPTLKKKEMILEQKLGSKVSLAPMTLRRIRNGNDLLLLKTKLEGTTLCGQNYLSEINIGSIDAIPFDEIYSYFFSAALYLIKYFDYQNNYALILNTAKSVIYCAEVQLMMNGIIIANTEDLIDKITQLGLTKNLDLIRLSKKVLDEQYVSSVDLNDFWFLAREYLIDVYLGLNKKYLGLDSNISDDSQIEIIKYLKFSYIKNIQFLILSFLEENFNSWKIFIKINIEKCFWYCLLCLIMAIQKDFLINEFYLNKCYFALNEMNIMIDAKDKNNYGNWRFMKNIVIRNWSMACSKEIF